MIIPVGYSQVTVTFSGTAVPRGAAVVFGVGNGAEASPTAVANDVLGVLATVVQPNLLNSVTIDTIRVKNGPNSTGGFAEIGAGLTGTGTSQASPSQVALLFSKVTDFGGRKGRGRMYLPGVAEDGVGPGGQLTSAMVTQYQEMADDLIAELLLVSHGMVLLHNDSTAPYGVTGLEVDGRVATQRRRLR